MSSFPGQSKYDEDGNLTSTGTETYTWNARNQLIQVSQGGTVAMSFTYDSLGRRTSKTVGAGTPTDYLYAGVNIAQETQGSTINPILLGLNVDERFARNDVDGRAYFLTDALNSTVALTSTTGTTQNLYSYDPYGNANETGSGFTNPYQYAGREADTAGLYYYRARYYSPTMGRFIGEDPIGFDGGQANFYAYVGGNPLMVSDPMGLMPPTWSPVGPFPVDTGANSTITVNYYGGGVGHIGISDNGDDSMGFYGDTDQTSELAFTLGFSGPGFENYDENMGQGEPDKTVTFNVLPADAFAAQNKLQQLFKNPGQYNLYKRNCATVAEDVLKDAHIQNVPNDTTPNALIKDLRNSQ